MNYKVKRRLTYATIAFYFVCGGIEYGVVFPTIWAYLQHLGARDETFLGLSISAFSMSAILAGPIIGKWFDRTKNAKIVLVVANMFEILGSLMYFAAISPWFVVLSRFICGIGSGTGAVVLADISHSTSVEDRTPILSKLQAFRQIGLMAGPVFNLVLQRFHFQVWNFTVNPMTVPGLFMAILGLILEATFIFTYFNLGSLKGEEKLAESLHHSYDGVDAITNERIGSPRATMNDEPIHPPDERNDHRTVDCFVADYDDNGEEVRQSTLSKDDLRRVMRDVQSQGTDDMIETAENLIINSACGDGCTNVRSRCRVPSDDNATHDCNEIGDALTRSASRFQVYIDEFLRDEVVVLLGLTFISFFAQMSLETIATPLTQYFYNFGVVENSMLFLFCGIEILFAFLGIAILSKKLEDRLLILFGIVCLTFSMAWFLVFIPRSSPGDWNSLYYFAAGIFFDLLGITLILACSMSLFSKLVSKERQGLAQGLRLSFAFAGTIFGPLWGGAVTNRPVILFSIPLALFAILLVLFVLSYGKLRITSSTLQYTMDRDVADEETERTPLLAGRRTQNQR